VRNEAKTGRTKVGMRTYGGKEIFTECKHLED